MFKWIMLGIMCLESLALIAAFTENSRLLLAVERASNCVPATDAYHTVVRRDGDRIVCHHIAHGWSPKEREKWKRVMQLLSDKSQ